MGWYKHGLFFASNLINAFSPPNALICAGYETRRIGGEKAKGKKQKAKGKSDSERSGDLRSE
jgi:hypothetical protein